MATPNRFLKPQRRNRFLTANEPEPVERSSLIRDALDFSETGDALRGVARSAASLMTAPGEGLARVTALGADKLGLDRVAEVSRNAADALKRQRADANALMGDRRSNYELGGEIAGNI